MRMEQRSPIARLCIIFCCLLAFCIPATAADTGISRSMDPIVSEHGGMVTVTVYLPPSFTGVIVEDLPAGYSFAGTTHLKDGFRLEGQRCIFAVIGEETIRYTLISPDSGCGVLQGEWEDVGSGTKGQIPPSVLSVTGSDSSQCSTALPAPGFSLPATLLAGMIGSILVIREGWQ